MLRQTRNIIACGLGMLFWVAPAPVSATSHPISWHGFIAQGVMQAQDNSFINDDGDVSFKLTDIGLNASYNIAHTLRAAAQVIYINGDNRYPEGIRLDYLLLDWTLVENDTWNSNLLIGRYKNSHWLYSSTRDIPHATPSVILPQSVYFDAMRDAGLRIQGVAWHTNYHSPYGSVDFKLSLGTKDKQHNTSQHALCAKAAGDIEIERSWLTSVGFSPLSEQWSAYVSHTDVDFDYLASASEPYVDSDMHLERTMLGLLYSGENYEIAAELFQETLQVDDFLFSGYRGESTAQGGYVQYRHFLSDSLVSLLRFDTYDRNKDDRSGSQLPQSGIPAHFGFADDLTAGLQWNIANNLSVQLEYHYVEGTARIGPIIIPNIKANPDKYWDMWALQLMYWY